MWFMKSIEITRVNKIWDMYAFMEWDMLFLEKFFVLNPKLASVFPTHQDFEIFWVKNVCEKSQIVF